MAENRPELSGFVDFGLLDTFNRPPTVCAKRFGCAGEAEAEAAVKNREYTHSRWPRYRLLGFLADGEAVRI